MKTAEDILKDFPVHHHYDSDGYQRDSITHDDAIKAMHKYALQFKPKADDSGFFYCPKCNVKIKEAQLINTETDPACKKCSTQVEYHEYNETDFDEYQD